MPKMRTSSAIEDRIAATVSPAALFLKATR